MGKRHAGLTAKKGRRTDQTVASRHTFSAGLLGHDLSASPWIINVSEQTLLGVDVAFACLQLICDAVAGSDIGEWDGLQRLTPSPLVRKPDPDATRRDFVWQATACLVLYQRVWIQSAELDGVTIGLRAIAPSRVMDTDAGLLVDGRSVPRSSMRLWRRSVYPTVSGGTAEIMTIAREVLAAEMAAGAYRSDFWQQGGAPVTVLESDQAIPDSIARGIRDAWATQRTTSPGKPAVLSRGVKARAFGADLGTSGANESGDKLKASVARFMGVPPSLVNVASEAGSLTYSTTEGEGIRFVRYTVQPYCDTVSDGWSEYLPGDSILERRVVIDPSRFMKPGLVDWYSALTTASGGPFITREEARLQDGRPEEPLVGEFAGAQPTEVPFG